MFGKANWRVKKNDMRRNTTKSKRKHQTTSVIEKHNGRNLLLLHLPEENFYSEFCFFFSFIFHLIFSPFSTIKYK